jgi:hypothetical protein
MSATDEVKGEKVGRCEGADTEALTYGAAIEALKTTSHADRIRYEQAILSKINALAGSITGMDRLPEKVTRYEQCAARLAQDQFLDRDPLNNASKIAAHYLRLSGLAFNLASLVEIFRYSELPLTEDQYGLIEYLVREIQRGQLADFGRVTFFMKKEEGR